MAYVADNTLIDNSMAHVPLTQAIINFKVDLKALQDTLESEATAGRISEREAALFEDRILALASELADSQRGFAPA